MIPPNTSISYYIGLGVNSDIILNNLDLRLDVLEDDLNIPMAFEITRFVVIHLLSCLRPMLNPYDNITLIQRLH